jgi:hypothetical protein
LPAQRSADLQGKDEERGKAEKITFFSSCKEKKSKEIQSIYIKYSMLLHAMSNMPPGGSNLT